MPWGFPSTDLLALAVLCFFGYLLLYAAWYHGPRRLWKKLRKQVVKTPDDNLPSLLPTNGTRGRSGQSRGN